MMEDCPEKPPSITRRETTERNQDVPVYDTSDDRFEDTFEDTAEDMLRGRFPHTHWQRCYQFACGGGREVEPRRPARISSPVLAEELGQPFRTTTQM